MQEINEGIANEVSVTYIHNVKGMVRTLVTRSSTMIRSGGIIEEYKCANSSENHARGLTVVITSIRQNVSSSVVGVMDAVGGQSQQHR